ncbi:MAG TPA: amino acid ABC transporter permease [Acidimicrobiales bacterium]|nr:amino acid ABC transporter permease [Acidimicrobiales bacterium]
MSVVFDNLDVFLEGMRRTLELSVLSFAIAMVLGTIVAGFRVSPVPPLRWAGTTYVELVRNTPLLVLMFIMVFGFPSIGLTYSYYVSAIIVLSAYTGTFVSETVRSGINAVSTGQAEAARAIGLTFPQTLSLVVMPQALRTVVAPLGGIFIALLKNSSLAVAINVPELTSAAEDIGTATASFIPAYLGAAAAYLMLTVPSGFAVAWIERKVAIKR